MSTILWVHGDALNPASPLFERYPQAPALFVFDEQALPATLKQTVFVYECLLEMPVEIRRGDPVHELRQFAGQHQATRIAAMRTPDPRRLAILEQLQRQFQVEVLDPPEFVSNARSYPLKRFLAFWKAIEKQVLPG